MLELLSPSVRVRRRPLTVVVIVTQLVTQVANPLKAADPHSRLSSPRIVLRLCAVSFGRNPASRHSRNYDSRQQ
jgi:hypothetical protein